MSRPDGSRDLLGKFLYFEGIPERLTGTGTWPLAAAIINPDRSIIRYTGARLPRDGRSDRTRDASKLQRAPGATCLPSKRWNYIRNTASRSLLTQRIIECSYTLAISNVWNVSGISTNVCTHLHLCVRETLVYHTGGPFWSWFIKSLFQMQ